MMCAIEEISSITGKNKSSIDADTLVPYIILMIVLTKDLLDQEEKPFNLKVRLIIMENFTVHVFGMNE